MIRKFFAALYRRLSHTPEKAYLASATSLVDLEARQREITREQGYYGDPFRRHRRVGL